MDPAGSAASIDPLPRTELRPSRFIDRLTALAEVLLCSSFPTQIGIAYVLGRAGSQPFEPDGSLSSDYVITLAFADAFLLVSLILFLLIIHGENPRDVFFGRRPPGREAMLGILLIPVVFSIVIAVMMVVQRFAPWLHNVAKNPLEELIDSRAEAGVFALVAVVAGGIREEVQRAFILRRFEQHLGGVWLGLVMFSLVFGLGHLLQGWDAAITTAILGAVWGVLYIRRGSILAPTVSHAGFNAAEILRYTLVGR